MPVEARPRKKVAKKVDKNFVSIWFWLVSMVIMAIPGVNVIMTLIWAFTGENEARKNYFKAVIVMCFLVVGVFSLTISLGLLPLALDKLGKLLK